MPSDPTLLDSTQLWLEFSPVEQTQLWQQSQAFLSPTDRWNAYLNRLCLQAFLTYLQTERSLSAQIWPNRQALSSFWSIVNGTAITVAGDRFVLLPSEAIDQAELRVPQEWVDLPGWAADYYLAVQVEPEAGWLQVWGYTTHQRLKTQATYDPNDRTYCLNGADLIPDLNVLWTAREFCSEATRSAIVPLPALSLAQAENLLTRLSNPDLLLPRLAVPFQLWGPLIEHGGWRQQLYERRQGLAESRSILQWFQTGVSTLAQQLGWERLELQAAPAGARSGEPTDPNAINSVLTRSLTIAGQPYELQISPQGPAADRTWRFELRPTLLGGTIPGGFILRLLTEDLQPFEGNEAIATSPIDRLFIEVTLEPGEGTVWEIEPFPNEYDREILRF
jgi:hypothetical protein